MTKAGMTEAMRLDLFLKVSRLIPRRSLADEVCSHGAISVNGQLAKSAHLVKEGDVIEWRRLNRVTTVRVARIPKVRPAKQEATALYETVTTQDGQRFQE